MRRAWWLPLSSLLHALLWLLQWQSVFTANAHARREGKVFWTVFAGREVSMSIQQRYYVALLVSTLPTEHVMHAIVLNSSKCIGLCIVHVWRQEVGGGG
jgi:hypothetical protein